MRRAGVPVARPDAGKSDFRSDVNRTIGPLWHRRLQKPETPTSLHAGRTTLLKARVSGYTEFAG